MISKEEMRKAVYDFIKDYGPCTSAQIMDGMDRKYKRNLTSLQLSSCLKYLHNGGEIENVKMGSRYYNTWKIPKTEEAEA